MQKLIELQKKINVPKNQYNSFGKYKYRSLEDITEAVKPIASELGILITVTDEIVLIGDRYYIKATATAIDAESGLKESVTAYAREPEDKKGMDSSQITGTASSYARKYALNGLLMLDDNKDPDTDEHHVQTQKNNTKSETKDKSKQAPEITELENSAISTLQIQEIMKLSTSKGIPMKQILSMAGKGLSELTSREGTDLIVTLQGKADV